MRARLIPALALVAVTTSVSARAQDADPDALVSHGIGLRREGRDAEALGEFRQAYAARASPRTLAQIALAEQALGRWLDAEADLLRALGAADDAWIALHRALLEQGLTEIRKQLGWLEVTADVEGAELWIDGVRVATLPAPQPIRVPAGSAVLEVRAPGYATVKRIAFVDAGAHARQAVRLVPLAAEPPSPPPAPSLPLAASEPAARVVPSNGRERALGLVLVGAGVVALGVGGYFGVRTFQKKSERDPHCQGDACDAIGVSLDGEARSSATIATIGIGAGLALVGGGLFLTWDARARTVPVALRLTPHIGMNRAELTLGGVW
jgi:hypothetical protein